MTINQNKQQLNELNIGHNLSFKPLVAAPLAGLTTRAFRDIVLENGAGAAYGEMISAQALCYANKRTLELLDIAAESSPKIVQLFGHDPAHLEKAGHIVAELGAEMIDINMGCPVAKVVNNGEGASLAKDPAKAALLVQAAAKSGLPISVKIRSGWDKQQINAPDFAKALEQAGAAMIALHARTRDQFYQGQADWDLISVVKQAISIPLLGNGDIFNAKDAAAMLSQTACDGLMIGRGMLGNPWLFAEVDAYLAGADLPQRPNEQEVLAMAIRHLKIQSERFIYWRGLRHKDPPQQVAIEGELEAVRSMRGHLGYYVKGMPGAANLRYRLNQLTRVYELEQLFSDYLAGKV